MVKPFLTDNWRQGVGLSYNGACICTCDCFSQKSYLYNKSNDLIKPVLAAFLSVVILKLDFLSSCFNFIAGNTFQPTIVTHVYNCFNNSLIFEGTGLSDFACNILFSNDLTYLPTVHC
jgi:hypothetical protein